MKLKLLLILSSWALLTCFGFAVPGTQSNVNSLIEQLGDADGQRQLDACKELTDIGSSAVEPLTSALRTHSNSNVRKNAAVTLGRIHDRSAMPYLILALEDDNGLVRMSAAWALGEIGDKNAVDALCGALDDSVWNVRMRAAEALGKIGDPKANAHLFPLLKDSQEKVREAAKRAMDDIRG